VIPRFTLGECLRRSIARVTETQPTLRPAPLVARAPVPMATPAERALAIARLVPELGIDGMRDVERFIRTTGSCQ
jgi:hypothetical protein